MPAKNKIMILSGIVLIISLSFRKKQDIPLFPAPANFPKPSYNFSANALTNEGIELGKTLFYDAIISSDNTISCGSCHQQSAGFTQHGHALSHGIDDKLTRRNSMPLFNLAWSESFGWDGGVHDLDLFAISPITNPAEMNESMARVLDKLRKSQQYPALFKKAFGSEEINTERFLKALSQFMLTMVSANSKYDKYMRYEGVELNETELAGMEIVKQKCASCHAGELFTDYSFRNNGLTHLPADDKGRFEVNQNESDSFKFKVPSLRNLGFTAPYMHDGRFKTLEEVLAHYTSTVESTPFLDPVLNQNGKTGIMLSKDEQQKIVSFLRTLDDEDFIKNTRFAENTLTVSIPKKDIDADVVNFRPVSGKVKAIFNESIDIYLKIKEAIKTQQTGIAAKQSDKLPKVLKKLNSLPLANAEKVFFNTYLEKLSFDCEHIIEGEYSTEHQSEHFIELSKNFYVLIASFKPDYSKLYYHRCENSDLNWLSDKINEVFPKNNCDKIQTKKL